MPKFFCCRSKKVSPGGGERSRKQLPSLSSLSTEVKADSSRQSTQRLSPEDSSKLYRSGIQLVRQENAEGALKNFTLVMSAPPSEVNISALNKHCVALLGRLVYANLNTIALQRCDELVSVTQDKYPAAHSKYKAIKELLERKKVTTYKEFQELIVQQETEKQDVDSSVSSRSISFSLTT